MIFRRGIKRHERLVTRSSAKRRGSGVLNNRDVMYLGTNLMPRGGDYTTSARQAVLGGTFAFKQPISYNLRLTLKM